MSLRRSFSHPATGTRGVPPDPALAAPLSDAELCERAVQAIWRSLDEHELIDQAVRDELAMVLEPLTALPLGPQAQRLIDTLRLPDPIDPVHLYWLTRRLLTLVPELQATAVALSKPDA
jgi:hypothetical protein